MEERGTHNFGASGTSREGKPESPVWHSVYSQRKVVGQGRGLQEEGGMYRNCSKINFSTLHFTNASGDGIWPIIN